MNIILLGAPGAGKGTQAQMMVRKFGIPQIATGDLFRDNMKNETELGKKIQQYMDSGDLVPDEITMEMLKARLQQDDCKNGFILDGVPRTLGQAELLQKMLTELNVKIDVVLYFEVEDEVIIKRLSSRWTCTECGHIYNTFTNSEKVKGKCDVDGSELYQRDDQKEEIVRNRISVYMESTMPLVAHYEEKGLLQKIDAMKNIQEVNEQVMEVLGGSGKV